MYPSFGGQLIKLGPKAIKDVFGGLLEKKAEEYSQGT